jgi:hypothetical protein
VFIIYLLKFISKGIQSRVTNGSDAHIQQYLSIKYIQIEENESEMRPICGADIIDGHRLCLFSLKIISFYSINLFNQIFETLFKY